MRKRPVRLTPEHLEMIKKHARKKSDKEIAQMIGCERGTVSRRRREMGIKAHNDGRFSKGNPPPNKGKKQSEYMSADAIERTKATRFKKGQLPHNTKHNGTISKRKDSKGYYYYFIRLGKRNWQPLHRYVWERKKGKIPDGHNVQFKDGDTLNCSIDNLYLVTRQEQAQHNKYGGRLLPYEARQSISLLNRLKKKIDEKQDSRP